jgi:hypothetical protein
MSDKRLFCFLIHLISVGPSLAVDTALRSIHQPEALSLGADGRNITVAVIDTGVSPLTDAQLAAGGVSFADGDHIPINDEGRPAGSYNRMSLMVVG